MLWLQEANYLQRKSSRTLSSFYQEDGTDVITMTGLKSASYGFKSFNHEYDKDKVKRSRNLEFIAFSWLFRTWTAIWIFRTWEKLEYITDKQYWMIF